MIQFDLPCDVSLLLRESAEKFIQQYYGLEPRQAMLAADVGTVPPHWNEMAELGWLAGPSPEDLGGLGLAPVQMLGLLGTLGAGLVLEPVREVLSCATALAHLPEQIARGALAPILTGEGIEILVAGPGGEALVEARSEGDLWHLQGTVDLVPGGAAARAFWVAVSLEGNVHLLRLPASAVTVDPYRMVDGQGAARLVFDGVTCPGDAAIPDAMAALEQGAEMGLFAALAEATGVISALYQATLDYVKLREQFGRPIGRFQVIQHRLADMYIAAEEAHSMAQLAAEALESADSAFRRRILSAAKVKIDAAAKVVSRDAIQLHGGMGMTDELAIGHLVKRLLVLGQVGGRRTDHLRRFAQVG